MSKVLVVDSSVSDIALFRKLLGDEGAQVEVCQNSVEAKQVVEANPAGFSAVFIAWDVTDFGFVEMLALFRQRWPETPVVAMFEELATEFAGRAYRLGARNILEKPLLAERVKACWRDLVAVADASPEKESRFDPYRTILIGDTSQERFRLLEKILRDDFHLQALHFSNYTDLKAKVESDDGWLFVLIADDLPFSRNNRAITVAHYFITFEMKAPLGCLISDERVPADLKMVGHSLDYISVPNPPSIYDHDLHAKIRTALAQRFGLRLLKPAQQFELNLNPGDDHILREQIRSLSNQRDLDKGQEILKHLILMFFECASATVERLGQGLSGARVFLLHISGNESYVLKISVDESRWKLGQEVSGHERAMGLTGRPPLKVHLPSIRSCRNKKWGHIASYENWTAVCYDYLGDKKVRKSGGIIDLETLLLSSPKELIERTRGTKLYDDYFASGKPITKSRSDIFVCFLDWLCKEWCRNNGKILRAAMQLWSTENCPPKNYPRLPPYKLKSDEKKRITDFLISKDAEKVRQLLPSWDSHRKKVWDFVYKDGGQTGLSVLDEQLSVIFSPAHGDLNANNVIIWLEEPDHPLLIDFPFFQESGHAMQDFARLEIETIYALMDCQAENSAKLSAGDHTHTQLPLWIQLIDHLLDENWRHKKRQWGRQGVAANVKHSLGLIQLLRQKAFEVQRQVGPTNTSSSIPRFFEEYLPALLYYTLREIGYPSRTIFKRLLAVYSASQILTRLDQLSAERS